MNKPQPKATLVSPRASGAVSDVRALLRSMLDAVEPELDRVSAAMRGAIRDAAEGFLAQMVEEHLETGGKRTRARLALAAGSALGVESDALVPWAAACELLHNATLVHDDIQDGDRIRRGEPALWVRHGRAQAINAGDALLLLPMTVLEAADALDDGLRWRLTACLTRRALATASGQAAEIRLPTSVLREAAEAWGAWLDAARGKSGQLFALPIEGAALVAGWEPGLARVLGDRLTELGVLYQIHDDVLGLFAERSGRVPGSDVREGKITSLVAVALERAEHRRPVREMLERAPEITDEDVRRLGQHFVASGTLRTLVERARVSTRRLIDEPTLAHTPELAAIVARLAASLQQSLDELLQRQSPRVSARV